jgi:hypothetical protein
MKSPVSQAIERAIANGVCVSVYLDDFIGSHNDRNVLEVAYDDIRETCAAAGLLPNPGKLIAPSEAITAFNCELKYGSAEVTDDRVGKFLDGARSELSRAAFQNYRQRVASRNF